MVPANKAIAPVDTTSWLTEIHASDALVVSPRTLKCAREKLVKSSWKAREKLAECIGCPCWRVG